MKREIEILKKTRQYLLDQISELTVEQLNEIPAGFNNNIIWNLGHLFAVQQSLCYMRANLSLRIDQKYIDAYKPGTKPEKLVDAAEIEAIKQSFITVVDQLEVDYNNHLFANYTAFTNRYGFEHKTIDDSISFILYHEGLHLSVITVLKKLLRNK